MRLIKCLAYLVVALIPFFVKAAPIDSTRALRVDPSYFDMLYPEMSAKEISEEVVNNAIAAGANTLFLYAYSPQFGAFYNTNYSLTSVEERLGTQNIFSLVYDKARAHGMRVIAVIPINDFRVAWERNAPWRSKMANGDDYKPFARSFYLSVWHPDYQNWFKGFVTDIAEKFPDLYAVEAVEPSIDCLWTGEPDYNSFALAEFQRRYPNSVPGDPDWKVFRAQGLTELIGMMSRIVHAHNIRSAVVHTWTASHSGRLYSSELIRNAVGFDFDGVLNLRGGDKIDVITGEFLWQQWAAEYESAVFTPAWTRMVALDFAAIVGKRSVPILHVEISPWNGPRQSVTPTIDEFEETLKMIRNMGVGIDVYDYSQMETRQAWHALSEWNQ